MLQYERNLNVFNRRRIIYIKLPSIDIPTLDTREYMYYEEGTYECYELFRSKAKITTYKSLKWHLLVLWYLNPSLDQDEFVDIAQIITEKKNGFTSFSIHPEILRKMIYEVSMIDLDKPPKNKLRKVIFKLHNGLDKSEKLRIVGQLIGRSKKIHVDDVYACMIDIHDMGHKITLKRVSEILNVSLRTIHRHMPEELKREKELLNKDL
tara:strand:+ start:2580 stop:3203 length:624 start_codon:yes stop_codon:yes gene_type:complete